MTRSPSCSSNRRARRATGRPPRLPVALATRTLLLLLPAAGVGFGAAQANDGGDSRADIPAAHCTDDRAEDICWIPGGAFWMGRHRLWLIDEIGWQTRDRVDARPVHRVELDGFWMDRREVTAASYLEFVRHAGREPPFHWRLGFPEDRARFPVYNVDWEDAAGYCRFRGKRLPTEAEWERAARGGREGDPWPWGREFRPSPPSEPTPDDPPPSGADEPNPAEPPPPSPPRPPARVGHPRSPTEVGSFPPNGYGLFDMIGNVAEWVEDGYDPDRYALSAVRNPRGPENARYRVFRGGSWADTDERIASVSYRNFTRPDTRVHSIGFRCALDHRPE